jgi:uracil-DNA glycosylase
MSSFNIPASWKGPLSNELTKSYWPGLTTFVSEQYATKTVYPPSDDVFRALELCPFESVKVVILGQDPYHGPDQANGLSFAVNEGVPIPPSLRNIYLEIKDDLGITPKPSGDLSRWAKQGVLLLNSVLTVLAGAPASHSGKGWERFTDAAIEALNNEREHVVYMLWGNYAKEKGKVVDRQKNLVLTSGHPSPLSVQHFRGNHHFSQCNQYLIEHHIEPIDWR